MLNPFLFLVQVLVCGVSPAAHTPDNEVAEPFVIDEIAPGWIDDGYLRTASELRLLLPSTPPPSSTCADSAKSFPILELISGQGGTSRMRLLLNVSCAG